MTIKSTIGALVLAFAATACTSTPAPQPQPPQAGLPAGTLTGTVSYRERIALPADAVVKVQIADVALMDAPSRTIAETRIETGGRQVPIPFTLNYAADRPESRAEYAVSARIETADGTLLFITDTRNALPASGKIDLLLVNARR